MNHQQARDAFGLLLGVTLLAAVVGDIVVPTYDLPASLVALVSGLVTAWFALRLVDRDGKDE